MANVELDYLCIGSFCFDEAPEGRRPGGTVSYAGRAAIELGATVGVFTSGSPSDRGCLEEILRGAQVRWLDSPESLVFRNTYSNDGHRTQHILSEAASLSVEELPEGWKSAPIVHLGPLADDVPIDFVDSISEQSLLGVTPQGWLRRRRSDGLVERQDWAGYSKVLDRADILVLSEQDVPNQQEASRYLDSAKLTVITRAGQGADVIENGRVIRIPAFPASEVDPTGAGDVFAAAFFLEFRRSDSPLEAARFAAAAAAFLVEKPGIAGVVSEAAVRGRMSEQASAR